MTLGDDPFERLHPSADQSGGGSQSAASSSSLPVATATLQLNLTACWAQLRRLRRANPPEPGYLRPDDAEFVLSASLSLRQPRRCSDKHGALTQSDCSPYFPQIVSCNYPAVLFLFLFLFCFVFFLMAIFFHRFYLWAD